MLKESKHWSELLRTPARTSARTEMESSALRKFFVEQITVVALSKWQQCVLNFILNLVFISAIVWNTTKTWSEDCIIPVIRRSRTVTTSCGWPSGCLEKLNISHGVSKKDNPDSHFPTRCWRQFRILKLPVLTQRHLFHLLPTNPSICCLITAGSNLCASIGCLFLLTSRRKSNYLPQWNQMYLDLTV